MAQINVSDLTFCYEGSYDNIFENVSFRVDTEWKLGLIGRNGRGKTTFLNLLRGKYEFHGSITTSVEIDYFPYVIKQEEYSCNTIDVIEHIAPQYELWMIMREMNLIQVDDDVLYRPFSSLSNGEQTKIMLAVLFSQQNHFLLIDEPTNHLDYETREVVRDYLKQKKGYILVSHDKWFLDSCIDHVLVINRNSIVVERGNFTSWWENKQKQDDFELAENEKLKKEIGVLKESARKARNWADQVESTKIGFDSVKDSTRCIDTRAYIGEKSRRMQQRRKNLERRKEKAIEDKSKLLKDIESTAALKLLPLQYHKNRLLEAKKLSIYYNDKNVVSDLSFIIENGERILLRGKNGCGKSSVLKGILQDASQQTLQQGKFASEYVERINKHFINMNYTGELNIASGLKISYVSQTAELSGWLGDYADAFGIDQITFFAVLRKMDFDRVQFEKRMEEYSEGQKKKVMLARSLCEQAHLYIWDEPLNFIDIFSRMQIEELLKQYKPTMLLIEHDRLFADQIATKIIDLP